MADPAFVGEPADQPEDRLAPRPDYGDDGDGRHRQDDDDGEQRERAVGRPLQVEVERGGRQQQERAEEERLGDEAAEPVDGPHGDRCRGLRRGAGRSGR